jgi:hypothetical protein
LATPNYSYEKRQRELAKKRKNEEKRQRKLNQKDGSEGPADDLAPAAEGSSAEPTGDAPPPAAG